MIYTVEFEPNSLPKRQWNKKLRERFAGDDEWKASGGRVIPMSMMLPGHLQNAYRMLAENLYQRVVKHIIQGDLPELEKRGFIASTERLMILVREGKLRGYPFGNTHGIQDIVTRAALFRAQIEGMQNNPPYRTKDEDDDEPYPVA